MDKTQNSRKPAAISKKDILEIIALTLFVVLWTLLGF